MAWNWNLRLACFVLYHEIRGEKKYQQNTVGIDDLKKEKTEDDRLHASIYQPINYYTAEKLFDHIFFEDIQGSLLDMGCGKGRLFSVGAAYGFKHIIGVDFSAKLCECALANARILMGHTAVNVEVICADATTFIIPTTVNTIFLFNPFDSMIMRKMLRNLNESIIQKPRPIKVLYANPVCKNLFIEAGFIETFYFKKLAYLEGAVLESE